MSGQLTHMEKSLQPLQTGDFRRIVHDMEIQRIRYAINSYLRARLHKIENFSKFFLDEDLNRTPDKKRLSPSERTFAENYEELKENHFKQLVLRHIPPQQVKFPLIDKHEFNSLNFNYRMILRKDWNDQI